MECVLMKRCRILPSGAAEVRRGGGSTDLEYRLVGPQSHVAGCQVCGVSLRTHTHTKPCMYCECVLLLLGVVVFRSCAVKCLAVILQ